MEIVIFKDIETSKNEIFSLFEKETDNSILIDFGDNFIDPQILYFMLFIQREAVGDPTAFMIAVLLFTGRL